MRVLLLITTHLSLEHITFLQEKWTAYDCDHLVQDAIQREDEEARARTVRRGWNRTAGSRYAFAADGVTFAAAGAI